MNEINVSKIIGAFPIGTQVYSPAYGGCVFKGLEENGLVNLKAILSGVDITLSEDDILAEGGELMVYPSRYMRDWSKLSWNKGDVMRNSKNGELCIFAKFASKNYDTFDGFYCNRSNYSCRENVTETWDKVTSEQLIKSFINTIENELGGKLNRSTLKIEKETPKYKSGDVVVVDYCEGATFICIYDKVKNDFLYCFARVNSHNGKLYLKKAFLKESLENRNIRPATDSEKQQLFDALAKKNKAWDAEKKQIVVLPKKCELKPFDKVLVRDRDDERWEIDFFGYYDEDEQNYAVSAGIRWNFCIPYNDSTKHLLGTTDEWKGGEQ